MKGSHIFRACSFSAQTSRLLPCDLSHSQRFTPSGIINSGLLMNSFAILNSRKRAIIALIHTVVFLCVAGLQTTLSHASAFSLHGDKVVGGIVLLSIYTIVTTVLLILLRMASHATERLYFALCATSAAFGLLRILLGDPALHAGILRVFLLSCATVVGLMILRAHSRQFAVGPVKAQ